MYNMQNLSQDFTQEGANASWQFKFQEGQIQFQGAVEQPHIKLGKANCRGGGGIKAPPEVNPVLT